MRRGLLSVVLLCALFCTGCSIEKRAEEPLPGDEFAVADAETEESSAYSEENLDSMLDTLIGSIRENNSSGHIVLTPAGQSAADSEDDPAEASAAETSPAAADSAQPVFEAQDGGAAVFGFAHIPADPEAVLTVPETLGGLPVTAVGKYGFYGAAYAAAVVLPETVSEMGDHAFDGSGITQFSFVPAESLTAGGYVCFDCPALETVSFADRAYTFGDYCFSHSGVQSVTGADTVLTLGNDCFKGLETLKTLTFRGGLTTGDSCFKKCTALSEITLEGSTLALGDHSFQSTGVRTLTLTDCTGTLGAECFADCAELRRVTIGEGITALGDYAFSGCRSLRTAELPASLTEIAEGCFSDCPELTVTAPADSAAYRFAEQNGIKVIAAE